MPTPTPSVLLCTALSLLSAVKTSNGMTVPNKAGEPSISASYWYDWAWYGGYPHTSYQSFGANSPWPNLVKEDQRCYNGLTFLEPRGHYVETPGPIVMDNKGNLVWMESKWGQAMDLRVQKYQGKDYITFWYGFDSTTFGSGSYLMLDESYEVVKEVRPVGDGLDGDLHEFHITENGTGMMTIYTAVEADMSGYGMPKGWIYDSLFQEVDLETGELIFEWRASDHYKVHDSKTNRAGQGTSKEDAFDFFHINSIDKDANGDYLISSRYMCAVACISHEDGRILWQLGGDANSFEDLSEGAVTNMTWNHHAAWYENTTLTLFDNGSSGKIKTADYSRGLMIDLDLEAMTAKLVHSYVAPLHYLAPSQGSVQTLPNGNVFVGWGHTPGFTEYTMDGEVLCDTHFGPIWFADMAFTKSYRTFKFDWVGKPKTLPDVASRPSEGALYVSWNGATEVKQWKILSTDDKSADDYKSHEAVDKTGFETKISLGWDVGEFVRVVALDSKGEVLASSEPISRHQDTPFSLREAPERWTPWFEPVTVISLSSTGIMVLLVLAVRFYPTIRRSIFRLSSRSRSPAHKYEPVSTTI